MELILQYPVTIRSGDIYAFDLGALQTFIIFMANDFPRMDFKPGLITGLLVWMVLFASAQTQTEKTATLLVEGKTLFDQGQYSNASHTFKTAYEQSSNVAQQLEASEGWARSLAFGMQFDSSLTIYRKNLALALAEESSKYIVLSAGALSETLLIRGQDADALPYQRIVIDHSQRLGDLKTYSDVLVTSSYTFLGIGETDSAKYCLDKSLEVKQSTLKDYNLRLLYNAFGYYHSHLGNYDSAFYYYYKNLEMSLAHRDSVAIVANFANLVNNLLEQEEYDLARTYNEEVLALAYQMPESSNLGRTLHNMGLILVKKDSLQEALRYYEEALAVFEARGNFQGLVSQYADLGALQVRMGNKQKAENYFLEAVRIVDSKNLLERKSKIYMDLAQFYLEQGQLSKAQSYLDQIADLVTEINRPIIKRNWHRLQGRLWEKQGRYQAAFKEAQLVSTLNDTLYNQEQSKIIHELEARYERTRKDQEIAELNTQKQVVELKLKKSRRSNFLVILGLILAAGLLVVLYLFNRQRRKNSQALAQKNQVIAKALGEKEILLEEIHHRVKNNMQIISSLLSLQTDYIEDDKAQNALREGRNRVQSMAIIHQNLYQEEQTLGIEMEDYIQNLSESLFNSYNISPDRIHLKTEIDNLQLDVETVIPLGLILNELLTNALKYAFPEDRNGEVLVRFHQAKEGLVLEVKDNGIGIPENISTEQAGGFGLKLIQTFAQKLRAQVSIQNQEGTLVQLLIQNYKMAG